MLSTFGRHFVNKEKAVDVASTGTVDDVNAPLGYRWLRAYHRLRSSDPAFTLFRETVVTWIEASRWPRMLSGGGTSGRLAVADLGGGKRRCCFHERNQEGRAVVCGGAPLSR